MLIDIYSPFLLKSLVCPISRESLIGNSMGLLTTSGYLYPGGDFRVVSSLTQSQDWVKGQLHYENYFKKWTSHSAKFYLECDAETEFVYKQLPLLGKVLDVGGGYGIVAKQANVPADNIVCVDPMVCKWADVPEGCFKDHYSSLASLVRIPAFAEDLPLQNSSVDTVHMRSCLDHFANPHRALLEARRVLVPDGQLIIGLALEGAFKLNENSLFNKLKGLIKNSFVGDMYEHFFDSHMFHPTDESLRRLLESSGFEVEKWIFQPGYSNVVYVKAIKSIKNI